MTAVVAREDLDEILATLDHYLGDDPPKLSLPPHAYTSTELWELEKDRIFSRSWILIAHADQLANVGDYVSVAVAGEPVVVSRGDDGLHALSPVCRHRLMPLIEPGAGNVDGFTCPYHRWMYHLDGRLRGAPYMAANLDFDPKSCRLPVFAIEEWNGFVWANFDAHAEPIGKHLDLLAHSFTEYRLSELVQVDSWSLPWRANWKLVMENGHENYHVLGLHQETLEPFLPGGADIYMKPYSPWVSHARLPYAAPMEAESLELNETQKANGMAMIGFPCSAFLGLGDQVVWFSFIPTAIDCVQVMGGILTTAQMAARPDTYIRTQQTLTAMINEEDRMGLEAVQRGASSRYAERGHLCPKEQPGMIAFYQNLARALATDGRAWPGEL
jgi:phenylpropionate dioxygenase-like ring-hydroxylating dioxygenase large terminal subunit